MKKYKLVGVIQRAVIETYDVEISAETVGEAQDLLYEILSDYPDSELVADRMTCVKREGSRPNSIVVELVDSEAEVFEEVFSNDEPSDDDQA